MGYVIKFVGMKVLESFLDDEPCHRMNGNNKAEAENGVVSQKARNPN